MPVCLRATKKMLLTNRCFLPSQTYLLDEASKSLGIASFYKYERSLSMPINFLPRLIAATPVVPLPQNGSSTTSPREVDAAMIRSIIATGF